ncbi:hypothetical protein PV328_011393 [Microctonus aethiopoides]|uniref:phospholipase A2 n=1 Tax=Microctonus aethiopoides TaxID=144406 RepID=A0AA39C4Y6_9HYME|nr:hypothetical protein PV328_011393 [Microctonus aethiopoides]
MNISLGFVIFAIILNYSSGQNNRFNNYPKILTVNHSLIYEPILHKVLKNTKDIIRAPFHRIVPATLWCGDGNLSDNSGRLGKFFRTDSCCREHDRCDMNIEAGGTLHGLINNGTFTRSACSCDHRFFDCLKTVHSPKSMMVGITYFNILSPQCFLEDYPVMSCNQTSCTDTCCRQHDKCSFNIEANKYFGRLINIGFFTRSACFCDREFYDCLKNANNPLAMSIGHTYFTLLSPQCIGYDYPIISCTQYGGADQDWKWCNNFDEFFNDSAKHFELNLYNSGKYSPIEEILGVKFRLNNTDKDDDSSSTEKIEKFLKNEFKLYSNLSKENITFEKLTSDFTTAKEYSGFVNFLNNWNELWGKYYILMMFEEDMNKVSNFLKRFMKTLKEIPGPLWCDAEDINDPNDEIVIFKKSHNCCQEHEKCSFKIPGSSSFRELKNNGLFTKFACHCERKFYECLKNANNTISNKIGFTYFTVISPQCIGYGNPINNCDKSKYVWRSKCLANNCPYHFNKKFGWFDTPDF